ncbi:MAG: hypothetical protein EA359_06410 [Balneolaceae bacterium]|nr:MAG: hypothetical protein EA359_06410 [Balneolaceae bacterium]
MKYLKILSLAVLAMAFYAQGLFSENATFIWAGHVSTLFTVVYGYVKLVRSESFKLNTAGRKAYGIFDVIFTIVFVYFMFHISAFAQYSSMETFFLMTAILLIIVGKFMYYYKKEFAAVPKID